MLLNCIYISKSISDDFYFDVTELVITEDGNIYNGIKGGKVTTDNGIVITAEAFKYNKLTSLLESKGDVILFDKINNVTIRSQKIFYLKNKELTYTVGKSNAVIADEFEIDSSNFFKYEKLSSILTAKGDVVIVDKINNMIVRSDEVLYFGIDDKFTTKGLTKVNIENEYFIDTQDLNLLRKDMLLSSKYKTTIKDTQNGLYKLNNFTYLINRKILKGEKVQHTTNVGDSDSEKHIYQFGFFDFIKKTFSAKDLKIRLRKDTFGKKDNDPRISAVSGTGNEFNTFLDKGIFTSCKKTDKCPPWAIKAKKIRHDKVKKQIIYKDAWLNIYDFPIVYMPKFFHPDPTVKRQSGLLKPRIEGSKLLGSGVRIPYFYVISDNKDLTLRPRFYDDGKYVLQNEYRQKTKKTTSIADFSLTKNYNSRREDDVKDSRTHLFTKTYVDLQLDNFLRSNLEVKIQKVSNDHYLKIFNLDSPLLKGDNSVLESELLLELDGDEYSFSTDVTSFETLTRKNSDRFQYRLPSFNFSKNIFFEKLNGSFNFTSEGDNILKNTNELSTTLINNVNYKSSDFFSDSGIKNTFNVYFKNLNSVGKNSLLYKNSPQSEIMSAYTFNTSYPLFKEGFETTNTFEPKLLFKYSPHQMKNHVNSTARVSINSIYSMNRLNYKDSFEEGASLTVGFDYKKEKHEIKENYDFLSNKIEQTRDFIDFKLAAVFRDKVEKNISNNSSLNQRGSNIVGEFNYLLSDHIKLDYDFSIDNDLNTLEYNSIDANFTFNNFSTNIIFLEENGKVGTSNFLTNAAQYKLNDSNLLKFSTRRNREISLTEYYDLIYEYQNDCLTAGIRYKKRYYRDEELKPSEELFFTITIVPLGTFSPDAITRSN